MRDVPKPVSSRGRLARALRARLTPAGAVSLFAGSLLGLSLYLPWYAATAGPYAGEDFTGWFAFHRTDRVLACLGLLVALTVVFARGRRLAWARLVLGGLAAVAVASELLAPPGDALILLWGGFVALLAAGLGLGGALLDLAPQRYRGWLVQIIGSWRTTTDRPSPPRESVAQRPRLRSIRLPPEAPREERTSTGVAAPLMTTGVRAVLRHGPFVVGIVVVALVTGWPVLGRAALDGDNLAALSVGALPSPWPLVVQSTFEQTPFYRPLAYLTIWVQYHTTGIAPEPYFAVNLALYVACGIALYFLVWRLIGFRIMGFASALFLLADESIKTTLLGIGSRTQSMACLFALVAVTMAFRGPARRPRLWAAGLFLVLLAAALSKEVGLAASAAVLALAVIPRTANRRELVAAGAAAVIVYVALRLGLAGAGLAGYCDELGYFEQRRNICYGEPIGGGTVLAGTDLLAQYAYNVAIAFIGIFFPAMVDDYGALSSPSEANLAVRGLGFSLVAAVAVGIAVIARPRHVLPLLALIAGNAILSFAVYRSRNLVPGVGALLAAAAVGFAIAGTWVARIAQHLARRRGGNGLARVLVGAGAVALTALALVQSATLNGVLEEQNEELGQKYPCDQALPPGARPGIVKQSKAYYGVEEGCEESESTDSREPG